MIADNATANAHDSSKIGELFNNWVAAQFDRKQNEADKDVASANEASEGN